MAAKRFIMNAGRTSKQGQQINVGKDHAEYQAIVSTLTMHPDDMKDVGIARRRDRPRPVRDDGEAIFLCQEGKVPARDDLRPLRPADLPAHGAEHRRHRACPPPRAGKSRSSRSRQRP